MSVLSSSVVIILNILLYPNTYFGSYANCIPGCSCSNGNDAATCCLLPLHGKIESTHFLLDLCYVNNTTNFDQRWPQSSACLPSWRQLQVRLTRSSWPTTNHANGQQFSCTEYLERLVLVGSLAGDDGLLELKSYTLRNLFFHSVGVLHLERLTIHQTQLLKIEDGFLDQLRAVRIRDVEISRNLNLTSAGLGVGWLASAPHLRLLDLSRNKLSSVDLAKWGFPAGGKSALATLVLTGNQITYLKPKTFERASNLIKLDLSDNLLESLSLNVFNSLESLKILNLQGNRLTLPGLQLDASSLLLTLPNLVQLQLASNPLLITNSTSLHWWLSNSCPRQLTKLDLSHLTHNQPGPVDTHVLLPPISWDRCPSLTELVLLQLEQIPCLSQSWLGLPPNAHHLPSRLRVRPSSLVLCPPSTILPQTGASVEIPKSNTPHSTSSGSVFLREPTAAIHAEHKFYSEPWFESAGDSSVPNSDAFHILRFRNVGVSTWILFTVLFILFFAVISLVMWGAFCAIRRYRRRHGRYHRKCNGHLSIGDAANGGYTRYTNVTAYPDLSYTVPHSIVCSKTAYSPLNLSVNGDVLEYPCSPCHPITAGVRLLSPSDSGMGDVTPAQFQHSVPAGLSPSSSQTSFRLSHKVPAPFIYNPMRCHVASLTSLRSAHLPRPAFQPSYAMCQSFLGTPQKQTNAATSTENISMGPDSSIFDDRTEECATLSDHTVPRQERRDLLAGQA